MSSTTTIENLSQTRTSGSSKLLFKYPNSLEETTPTKRRSVTSSRKIPMEFPRTEDLGVKPTLSLTFYWAEHTRSSQMYEHRVPCCLLIHYVPPRGIGVLLSLFYRWENWGFEKLNITQIAAQTRGKVLTEPSVRNCSTKHGGWMQESMRYWPFPSRARNSNCEDQDM